MKEKITLSLNEEEKLSLGTGVVLGSLLFVNCLFIISVQAWTLMALWCWFVSPLGVAKIGYFQSLGLLTLATFLQKDILSYIYTVEKLLERCVFNVIATVLCLFAGWVLHHFV